MLAERTDAIADLTTLQGQFLATRAVTRTDAEAMEQVAISRPTLARWRNESDAFREAHTQLLLRVFDAAVDCVRDKLHLAADTLAEGLEATYSDGTPDWATRRDCAKTLLRGTGVLVERQQHSVTSVDVSAVPDAVLAALGAWLSEAEGAATRPQLAIEGKAEPAE